MASEAQGRLRRGTAGNGPVVTATIHSGWHRSRLRKVRSAVSTADRLRLMSGPDLGADRLCLVPDQGNRHCCRANPQLEGGNRRLKGALLFCRASGRSDECLSMSVLWLWAPGEAIGEQDPELCLD